MSEDYTRFNEVFATVLAYWRYPRIADRVRELRVSAHEVWKLNKRDYFLMLAERGKKINPEDLILFQEAFEQGFEGIRCLAGLRRPDLEGRIVAHPKDAAERPRPDGRATHRYYGPRTP